MRAYCSHKSLDALTWNGRCYVDIVSASKKSQTFPIEEEYSQGLLSAVLTLLLDPSAVSSNGPARFAAVY